MSRPTKWAGTPLRYAGTKLDTIITGHLTSEQTEAYQQLFRIEEITHLFKTSHDQHTSIATLVPSGQNIPNYRRDPSPPPTYDHHGNRTNTRDVVFRAELDKERNHLIEVVANNVKDYVMPADYTKPTRTMEKIYIPVKDYPDINFVGLLLGPRGNTLRQLQDESGARLAIRGKGSVKDGKLTDNSGPGTVANVNLDANSDDLHVVITADALLKIDHAIRLTNEVIEKAISSPYGQNELKRGQLRELAILNGTLRETKPYDPEAHKRKTARDITSIVCQICGAVGHLGRDCKVRDATERAAKRQRVELPPWAGIRPGEEGTPVTTPVTVPSAGTTTSVPAAAYGTLPTVPGRGVPPSVKPPVLPPGSVPPPPGNNVTLPGSVPPPPPGSVPPPPPGSVPPPPSVNSVPPSSFPPPPSVNSVPPGSVPPPPSVNSVPPGSVPPPPSVDSVPPPGNVPPPPSVNSVAPPGNVPPPPPPLGSAPPPPPLGSNIAPPPPGNSIAPPPLGSVPPPPPSNGHQDPPK